MKKFITVFLSILMILVLSACSNQNTNLQSGETNEKQNGVESGKVQENDNASKSDTFTTDEITLELLEKAPANAETDFATRDVEGGVIIEDYSGSSKVVVIPETINGKPVVEIEVNTFVNNEEIKAVKLANSIKIIGNNAFENCSGLEIVVCGSGLERINSYAFSCCFSLKTLVLNDGLKTIDTCAIGLTDELKALYIPSTVIEIKDGIVAFSSENPIYCDEGSVAEQYAKEHNLNYELR